MTLVSSALRKDFSVWHTSRCCPGTGRPNTRKRSATTASKNEGTGRNGSNTREPTAAILTVPTPNRHPGEACSPPSPLLTAATPHVLGAYTTLALFAYTD